MWEKYFRIADHNIVIKGLNPEGEYAIPIGFAPFERMKNEFPLHLITLETGVPLSTDPTPAQYTFLFKELNMTCEFAAEEEYFEFRMITNANKVNLKPAIGLGIKPFQNNPIVLKMPRSGFSYITNLLPTLDTVSELNFLLWNAYGVASAYYDSIAIHSSVVIYKGVSVLFLGESGSGKSTHTQLWLRTIRDCKLLNDDSPIVRIMEGTPVCFGSPWSGKGNCFRNESYPIAGIVRIRPSPLNHIKRLHKIDAFTALYPSCPPSFSVDSELTDYVCNTLSVLIEKVPVYLLDCRPDKDAALLSCETIFSHQDINSGVKDE
jgi:hypothetical protein